MKLGSFYCVGIPAKVPGVMPEDKPGAGWSDEFDMSVMKH